MTDFEQKLREGLKKITGGENARWIINDGLDGSFEIVSGGSGAECTDEDVCVLSGMENYHDATLIAAAPALARFFLSVHTYEVHFLKLEDETWLAWNLLFRLSTRAETKGDAVNFVVGAIYGALAVAEEPLRAVRFVEVEAAELPEELRE